MQRNLTTAGNPVRLCFAPVNNCAPLVVAKEYGAIATADFGTRLPTRRRYVGQLAKIISRGFPGEFDCGKGLHSPLPDFCIFHREQPNAQIPVKTAWISSHLLDARHSTQSRLSN